MSWSKQEQEPEDSELARIAVHKHSCAFCGAIFECMEDSPCSKSICEICEIMKES